MNIEALIAGIPKAIAAAEERGYRPHAWRMRVRTWKALVKQHGDLIQAPDAQGNSMFGVPVEFADVSGVELRAMPARCPELDSVDQVTVDIAFPEGLFRVD